jgi:DEP domain-containing protein 5
MTQPRIYFVRIDNSFEDHLVALTHPVGESVNDFSVADCLHISNAEMKEEQMVVKVDSITIRGQRLEVTISKMIAESLKINSFSSKVLVSKAAALDVELDFAMLSFKRQFVQRGDMMRFKKAVMGRIIYSGQTINCENVQSTVQDMEISRRPIRSGIVTADTNIVFRSRSARIYWLVQISAEMWELDKAGNTYFELFLNLFVAPILDMWRAKDVSHSLSVVFFSRTFYVDNNASVGSARGGLGPTSEGSSGTIPMREGTSGNTPSHSHMDTGGYASQGLSYQDFFKVVIDNSTVYDKSTVLNTLKGEFWRFPRTVHWTTHRRINSAEIAVPSGASEGNILEAINTTFNVLDKHYMDRDLVRTGNSIVMITPGCGFFKVEPKLAQITKQRMMDNGIGMDLISLSQP